MTEAEDPKKTNPDMSLTQAERDDLLEMRRYANATMQELGSLVMEASRVEKQIVDAKIRLGQVDSNYSDRVNHMSRSRGLKLGYQKDSAVTWYFDPNDFTFKSKAG
jgi:hypothetical protein